MNLRALPLGVSIMLALACMLPAACADQDDLTEAAQEEVLLESQQSNLLVNLVNVTASALPAVVARGQKVVIAATLTPTATDYYQLAADITRPDGSSLRVKDWGWMYLAKGVATRLQAEWTADAAAAAGNYSVSLALARTRVVPQRADRMASFSVSGAQPPPPPPPPPPPGTTTGKGISISGRHIVDGLGKVFTARGPELVTASIDQLAQIDAIAATGANSMRMLLTLDTANNMTPAQFDQLVGRAVQHKLVVWVSLFTWDNAARRAVAPALGGGQLLVMADYLTIWKRQWLKDLVKKYDGWVVIDAMQEFVNNVTPPESPGAVREFVDAAKQHIRFFRQEGFTQPLEIMSSYQGRDLHAIVAHADEMLAVDTLTRNGTKQTMFGWQAYWGDNWYRGWQGGVLIGRSMTAAEAIQQFVVTRNYPIMVGLDTTDIPGTESYGTLMPLCSSQAVGWLWWQWTELTSSSHGTIVRTSRDGFAGAVKTNQPR